jgi:hypothetical protein
MDLRTTPRFSPRLGAGDLADPDVERAQLAMRGKGAAWWDPPG